jgi:hypothetical protein
VAFGKESAADRLFREFHRDNPDVYRELMQLVREALRRGRKKMGIKMLWEVARWNRFLRTNDEKYKLNNNYHSRYARLIMQKEPGLAGIFDTRELKS